jgi:ubiquinone/menaquinone biosynthesis C-methylase UbiE
LRENPVVSFETGTDAYGLGVGRYSAGLAEALCDAAPVRAGEAALDVGCGPGALAAELARRLGVEKVGGVEPSQPFLEAARAAVPGADLRQASAEELPFEDGAFDVALSQLVVNFMSEPDRGVAEMRRVARRTVASCVWDYGEGMTMLRAFWDAALELDPGAPDEAATMRNVTPGELRALWESTGLRDVETDELVVTAQYADFDDYWAPFPTGLAPSGAYCASLDEDDREALRAACFRRLGSPSGPFRLEARAWFVRGEV